MAGTVAANQAALRYDTGNVVLAANNDAVILNVKGFDTIGIQVNTGLTGTVSYDCSQDNSVYIPIAGMRVDATNAAATNDVNPTAIMRYFDTTAVDFFRVKITAFGSGSCAVFWVCENNPSAGNMLSGGSSITSVVPGVAATSLGKAEDAAAADGDTGVMLLGVRNDTPATLTSTTLDYGAIAITGTGAVHTVQNLPPLQSSLGNTVFRQIAAGTTNATSIKGASGSIGSITAANTSGTIKYLKFYNKASAPTVGTDTPLLVIGITPSSTYFASFDVPLSFSIGIASATTGLGTDADATAVTASDISFTIVYR